MAKDQTSTRIPRLEGASRIPLPGSIRPFFSVEERCFRNIRPATVLVSSRPTSFSSIRQPTLLSENAMKKSSSGDGINSAVSIVSKKTTNALKKFFSKPEKTSPAFMQQSSTRKSKLQPKSNTVRSHKETVCKLPTATNKTTILASNLSHPFTRSDTFVRESNDLPKLDTLDVSYSITAQSTPASKAGANENTRLLSPSERRALYKTHSLDSTVTNPKLGETITLNNNQSLQRTHIVESASISTLGFGETINLDVSQGNFDLDSTFTPTSIPYRESLSSDPSKQFNNLNAGMPDKRTMQLPLNSTISTEYLLDLTVCKQTPPQLNISQDYMNSSRRDAKNNTQLLYMTSPERCLMVGSYQKALMPNKALSSLLLKGAQSELLLPTHTPDDEGTGEPMEVDMTITAVGLRTQQFFGGMQQNQQFSSSAAVSMQELNNDSGKQKSRFSFGFDLTESTLDCSIELCDISLSSTVVSQPAPSPLICNNPTQSPSPHQQLLKKQSSFELDESLGILTPDQMKEFLDSTTNTNNLDLPLLNVSNQRNNQKNNPKISFHQMRIDQTPSPEDLPLDPVEVKTDITEIMATQLQQQQPQQTVFCNAAMTQQTVFCNAAMTQQQQHRSLSTEPVSVSCDTELSKADPMSKSNVSKISTSFITSVTSVTSLDTGYQGDGEMSRPASRGASDHSPSSGPMTRKGGQHQQYLPIRRQDPMTDSDFFTESDADDIFHRGDRRAQVIDGQLYGPMLQQTASVFISEDPQLEDSCMESSGIFTDVENRCDEDLISQRQLIIQDVDMSPDADSTDTVKSNRMTTQSVSNAANGNEPKTDTVKLTASHGQGQSIKQQLPMCDSQTSSTMLSSNDRISMTTENGGIPLSNRTSYCSVDSGSAMNDCKSFSSLEEVFASKDEPKSLRAKMLLTSTANTCGATLSSVKRVTPPRKHASLTSLCAIKSAHANPSLTPALTIKHATSSPSSKESLIGDNNPERVNSVPCVKVSVSTRPTPRVKNNTPSLSSVLSTTKIASCNVRRSQSVNKWDAVMNKIASNKLVKKNYSDVKSKVTTGVNAGSGNSVNTPSPGARCSPTSASAVQNSKSTSFNSSSDTYPGLHIQQGKCILQGAVKRGRSYSKDSQKSSQSDLSLSLSSSGSPKLIFKAPLRAAKKRDVRNLSISPTDQGPPPKAQQTLNSVSTRSKPNNVTLTHKKVQNLSTPSSNTTSTTLSTQNSGNSSKSNKKLTIFGARRLDVKATPSFKLPKDHSNLLGTQSDLQQQPLVKNKNGAGFINGSTNNSKPPTPTTENHHNANSSQQHPNKNFNNATTLLRSSSSSPVPSRHGKKAATAITTEKKISLKLQSNSRKTVQKQEQQSLEDATSAETLSVAELQQLKNLNRHSCNGRLDYQSLEQHLQLAAETQKHQHKGIEAMGVLLQYLAFDLDAFACPAIKSDNVKTKEILTKSQQLLRDTKIAYTELQDQLCDKEAYYMQRKEELEAQHRCELEKAQSNFCKMQLASEEEISSIKAELKQSVLEAENRETILRERIAYLEKNGQELRERSFDNYRLEMEHKVAQKQQYIQAAEERVKILQDRIESLEKLNNECRTRTQATENEFSQRLQIATQRENELLENIKTINKELNILRESKDNRERELKDKLVLTQDEIAVLRSSSRLSLNDSLERNNSPRNSSTPSIASVEISRLQSEAESLRCVLELKQKENSKLVKQNEELIRDADERAALQAKISRLESDHEMLQSEMNIKSEKEKELLRQIDTIQKAYDHESIKRKSLSFDKEALQYKLKQRSEQLHLVETKLQELSSRDLQYSSLVSLVSNVNDSSIFIHVNGDISSPIDKGLIEKTNSISWVLEMDNDTPETAASKMVKRAGSFRSVERSPSTRRQLSLSANAATGSNACNEGNKEGPIPLSQSMSATSVIRQHSNETVEFLGRANSRIRSKSVSVKSSDPTSVSSSKILHQTSSSFSRKNEQGPPVWKEPIDASSPLCSSVRSRTSTLKKDDSAGPCEEALFRRSSRKLITCDTSSLNSGERLEKRALPTHPSVHDLKAQKKCQEIQESAGEAMVSGTNSEDEGCSASSDEVASTSASTTSSVTSGSSSSLNHVKDHHMSLDDEVLLLDKINSLNGTPMEVSWSDEAEVFASTGSAV